MLQAIPDHYLHGENNNDVNPDDEDADADDDQYDYGDDDGNLVVVVVVVTVVNKSTRWSNSKLAVSRYVCSTQFYDLLAPEDLVVSL
ncbi:hypothetical protein ElyMa_004474900 [Elysia marginata]|uniref:Uncharacterized protein n=1 Tax=Elysia marginata TaxID=1093978 RepID=A0AAV4HIU0_9GAST|nr:hypothetical protein ElyMa_004474900 [Elysia marginata]